MQDIQASGQAKSIVAALTSASRRTGADFDYLLNTAMRESSLKPQAKSKTSSTSGLFQFIDQTWLDLVRRHGHEVGLGELSNQINRQDNGRHLVPNGAKKKEIIALKFDPKISAHMAGKFAEESRQAVESKLGRKLAPGELYIAHFMGASGGAKLIATAASDPDKSAEVMFPSAARANRAIFYHANGSARTVKEVYNYLTKSKPPQEHVMAAPKNIAVSRAPSTYVSSSAAIRDQIQYARSTYSELGSGVLPSTAIPGSRMVFSPLVLDVLAMIDPPSRSDSTQRNALEQYKAHRAS